MNGRRHSQLVLVTVAILLFCLPAAASAGIRPSSTPLDPAAATPGAGAGLGATVRADSQSADWRSRVQEEIAAREYDITWQDTTALPVLAAAWHAPNRAHNFRTYFTDAGIRVIPREWNGASGTTAWEWSLKFVRWGRPGKERAVEPAKLHATESRIEYDRGMVVEWYINDERGLEQGFTLAAPPSRAEGTQESFVVLDLALGGTLTASMAENGQAINFATGSGATVVYYSKLLVTDARGRALPARFEGLSHDGLSGIRLAFDDTEAVYPVTIDPLATSAAWTAESNQAHAELGGSVATAGDVNGDGYSDLVVGAYLYDNGESDEGRVFVYLGSAAGPGLTPAWTAESDQANAQFGYSVATAGDVNGDSYSDVIVGAYLYTNGQTNEGRAYVYLGSAAGPGAAAAWTAEGNEELANLGNSVATAGDVNGDGYSDVIVGAFLSDNDQNQEGRAYVYLGSASGLGATAAWTAESNQAGAHFGTSVGTAGDVNGDGYSDVIVGARFYDNGQSEEGRAFVYRGSAAGLGSTAIWTAESDQAGAEFGGSVAAAGDVNGDGYSDVIVGARFYDNNHADEGRALVYLGSASGLGATAAWTAEGNQNFAFFGFSVATAGDVNGDGYSDLIVGARLYDNGETNEGGAFVYLGSASGPGSIADWTVESNQAFAFLGFSVATAGDVNGDGYSDVIVGAAGYANVEASEGRALVYFGSAAGPGSTTAWSAEANQASAYFGFSVASAGDVNGDGYSDVIVGAYGYDNGQEDEGRAFVYLGSASGLALSPLWTAESDQASANFGGSVATAGDVNGDGYSDVIVGAWIYENGQEDEGRAFVYLGSASGLAPSPAWTAEGNNSGALLGGSVATAGDVNGDGYSDVIVGASNYTNGQTYEGRAFVYLGSASGIATFPAWSAEGDQANAAFGTSVAAAGDVNGDGYSDVIVGAFGYNNGEDTEGQAYVYLGSASGLATSAAWTADSNDVGASLGYSAATAGDVNGDGYSDVIVGALFYNEGEGRAYVFLGSASGLVNSPAWTAEGDQGITHFGVSVATAGDVDGDGFSDVIVGAWFYDNGQAFEGRAYVYLGSASGLAAAPAWTTEGDQEFAFFGGSVAAAGDVNGDGFSDVIVGAATAHDGGQTGEGRAFVYYGNDGDGLERVPRQARADGTAPIDLLGRSDSQSSFRLRALGRNAIGRGGVRLEAEVKALGTSFDGGGLVQGAMLDTGDPGLSGSAVELDEAMAGLDPGTSYHWRLRVVTDSPFFPHSPWFSQPHNNRSESDMRTGGCRDADGDGRGAPPDPLCAAGAVGDCNDADDGIWSPPGEAQSLMLSDDQQTGVTTLTWLAPADAGTTAPLAYDVLRSPDIAGFRDVATCIESNDGTDTAAADSAAPPVGSAFYYLVRAENGCPATFGLGSLGSGSDGIPRTAHVCRGGVKSWLETSPLESLTHPMKKHPR